MPTAVEGPLAASRPEAVTQVAQGGMDSGFDKVIDRAAAKIERRFTEENRRRQASGEPEAANTKTKEMPRAEAAPPPRRPEGQASLQASQLPHDNFPDIRPNDVKPAKTTVPAGPEQPQLGPLSQPSSTALNGLNAGPRETPGPPQPMFSQIEAGMRHAFIVRPRSVTVRLAPEELGEVQIKVSIEQDKVQAQIQTESQKVATILKDHQAELQQRLQQQGIELSRFEVRHENNPTQGDAQRQQQAFQGGPEQQGEGNRGNSRQGQQSSGVAQSGGVHGETAAGAASAEPVSIFDANGRLSLTA